MTLELAIAGVPMVTAYRAGSVEIWIARRVVRPGTVILANLVIGDDVIPEFIQEDCVPDRLAPAVRDLLGDTPARRRQLAGFAKIDDILSTGEQTPSGRAADIVLDVMRHKGGNHRSASSAIEGLLYRPDPGNEKDRREAGPSTTFVRVEISRACSSRRSCGWSRR